MAKGISQKTVKERGADRDAVKGPKRTADEILRDRADIARMRLEGLTQAQITNELGRLRNYKLSERTIAADLKAVREEWVDSSVENYEKNRLTELARIEQEERLAINGWNRSGHRKKRKDRTRTGTNDGKPFEEFIEEQEEEESAGNPAFLARLDSLRQRRCAILGFGAYQRSQDINAAIETLLAAGYIVRNPEDEAAE